MPLPRDLFVDPKMHRSFVLPGSGAEFRDQYYDRSKDWRPRDNSLIGNEDLKRFRNRIAERISGFANEVYSIPEPIIPTNRLDNWIN
jgi:hypothetical protein